MGGQHDQASGDKVAGRRRSAVFRSPAKLSHIVGQIYDCVVEPARWEAVLASICQEFSFASSMMGVLRGAQPICQYAVGVDPEMVARMPEFGAEIAELWGGMEQIQRYPVDEPIVNSQAVDPAVVRDNRYFKEWVARGICDAVVIFMANEPSLVGNVGFNRHRTVGAIKREEIEGLRLLAPHLRRAVRISDLFDMKAIEAATFGSALDSFAFGIILVDQALGIVHANKAAAEILKSGDSIKSDKGRLILADSSASAALERAVRQAASDETSLGSMGIGVPAAREGAPRVIHVLPLRQGTMRGGLFQRASAVLFIAPAANPPHLPVDALMTIYDLTPAEARIFEMISAGSTQTTIARTLGIAPSTVKTHVLHLFEKTGCTRQADLLKLAASLSAPA